MLDVQTLDADEFGALRRCCEREARWVLGNQADAEDAVQEAMLRAWRFAAAMPPLELRAWLIVVTRREALRIRARRRSDLLPDEPASQDVTEHLERRLDIQAAMQVLGESDRRLMTLRYGCDLTNERIGELTQTPVATVRVRLHRARARMRGALADHASIVH